MKEIALVDIFKDIYDYENRWYMIEKLGEMFGLDNFSKIALEFIVAGNISVNPDMFDVLKKFKLPTRDVIYDKEKVERWAGLIRRQMESLDKDGILRLDNQTILRESKNGRYVTVATMQMNVLIYKSIYTILLKSPEYLLKLIYGVYDALGIIIEFLDMEKK